jgi:hypothetical protein
MFVASMVFNVVTTSVGYGLNAAACAGIRALRNPRITSLIVGILALSSIPGADGGPVAGLACFISCMSAGLIATKGGFVPATALACTRLCAALAACPFIP